MKVYVTNLELPSSVYVFGILYHEVIGNLVYVFMLAMGYVAPYVIENVVNLLGSVVSVHFLLCSSKVLLRLRQAIDKSWMLWIYIYIYIHTCVYTRI